MTKKFKEKIQMRKKIIKIRTNVCIENLVSNINIDCPRTSFDRRDYRYARKHLTYVIKPSGFYWPRSVI